MNDKLAQVSMNLCSEEVTRRGMLEPCEKPAVAVRKDQGDYYPVCARHARGPEMATLIELVQAWRAVTRLEVAATPEPEPSDDPMDWTRLSNDALVSEGLAILDEECKDMSSAGLHLLHQYVYAVDAEHAVGVAQIHLEARKSADSERQKVVNYLAGRASSVAPVEVTRDELAKVIYEANTYSKPQWEYTLDSADRKITWAENAISDARNRADQALKEFRVSRRDGEDK